MWWRVRVVALSALLAFSLPNSIEADAAQQASQPVVLFQNVRIFDGEHDALSAPSNVLVRGNQIETISTDPIPIDGNANVTTIDGGGRTLMPGLIDVHWHAMLARPNPAAGLGQRRRLPQSPGGSRGDRHIDAGLYHHPRHGRAFLRAETRH